MSDFKVEALVNKAMAPRTGVIDFRLVRRHMINEVQRGRLNRDEVCDAHPELVRAASGIGTESERECPICEETLLRHVTYVFGKGLPAHGKCINDKSDWYRLIGKGQELTAYTVEVCCNCRWNWLVKTYEVGPSTRSKKYSVAKPMSEVVTDSSTESTGLDREDPQPDR